MLYKNQGLVHLIKPENECEGAHVWDDPKHDNLIILKVSGANKSSVGLQCTI